MRENYSGPRLLDNERLQMATERFSGTFNRSPEIIAYAPGRAEILGNHTDYNEGFVISCAVNLGCLFFCAGNNSKNCNIFAADLDQTASFDATDPSPLENDSWPNFVKGMYSILNTKYGSSASPGFDAMIRSDIPAGAGLSSSAALEIAAGLAFQKLLGTTVEPIDLARIAQEAENTFVGAQCGLLDQISSLFGEENHFILTDFRSLETRKLALSNNELCLIMCDTKKKHSLVDSKYNERRLECEQAAQFFKVQLQRPFTSLRDADHKAWDLVSKDMDETIARRALHIIKENKRVLQGRDIIEQGLDMENFGQLMFESHKSSRLNFENSCPELDFVVRCAAHIEGALGARLSGGGFGGSAIILADLQYAEKVCRRLETAFKKEFNCDCETGILLPSQGACIVSA
ncbi:MAG: galactokinase [Verrucomicrobiota bacterium]